MMHAVRHARQATKGEKNVRVLNIEFDLIQNCDKLTKKLFCFAHNGLYTKII